MRTSVFVANPLLLIRRPYKRTSFKRHTVFLASASRRSEVPSARLHQTGKGGTSLRKQSLIANQERFTPEFMQWLKENKVSRRQLKRDPASMEHLHQEWKKTRRKNRPRKPSLLQLMPNLSNMDLGTVVGNVQIAKEIFKTYRVLQGASIFKK